MIEPKEDEDMNLAVNELGAALDEVLLGASSSEVLRVIEAIDNVIDVKLAQFIEALADQASAPR